MKRKPEGWSVVLAGFWNRMIFTPEWVGSRLFNQDEQIETVVALLPVLPIIYRDKEVAIEISDTRIICRARNLSSDDQLRRSGLVAGRILSDLPETPIKGVGVNFGFRETSATSNLLQLFAEGDRGQLSESGWEIHEPKLVRRLVKNENILNLTLALHGEQMDVDFNFHLEPNEENPASHAVEPNRIVELRDAAITLLREVYGLTLEVDDDDY